MTRRRDALAIASPLWAVAFLTLSVIRVLAKDGAEAKLDTAISRRRPGSTIEVGWSTFMITDGKEPPFYGTPVVIRLVARDGTTTEAAGVETSSGSGHYTASIVVPTGGIDEVIVSMIGTSCNDDDVCVRADYLLPPTDDPLVTGTPGGVAPAGGVAPSAGVAPAAVSGPRPSFVQGAPMNEALARLIDFGAAFALAGGLAALLARRRGLDGSRAGH